MRYMYWGMVLAGIAVLSVVGIQSIGPRKIEVKNPVSGQQTTDLAVSTPGLGDVTILAVGDIMLGRTVEKLMEQNGAQYPFEKIADFLGSFDAVLANLEGPIPSVHKWTPNGSTDFNFKKEVAPLIAENNIKFVTLANNHTDDAGAAGYENTKTVLDSAGIKYFGYASTIDGSSMLDTQINDRRFIFLGFNMIGTVFDKEAALGMVQIASAQKDAFVGVGIHWGTEYVLTSNKSEQQLAHEMIDAGADLIIGHHPHVVQEIERYKDKYIFYSLGNFVFDQYFSVNTQLGLAVNISFHGDDLTMYLTPISIDKSQPQLMIPEEEKKFLEVLAARSQKELAEDIKAGVLKYE